MQNRIITREIKVKWVKNRSNVATRALLDRGSKRDRFQKNDWSWNHKEALSMKLWSIWGAAVRTISNYTIQDCVSRTWKGLFKSFTEIQTTHKSIYRTVSNFSHIKINSNNLIVSWLWNIVWRFLSQFLLSSIAFYRKSLYLICRTCFKFDDWYLNVSRFNDRSSLKPCFIYFCWNLFHVYVQWNIFMS